MTPVTERGLDVLCPVLRGAADEVRGRPAVDAADAVAALPGADARLDSDSALALLLGLGIDPRSGALPDDLAPLMAVVEAAPHEVTERLLTELLARVIEP